MESSLSPISIELDVCETLIQEHRQAEQLLNRFSTLLERWEQLPLPSESLVISVTALLQQLAPHMNVHFACEERCLFPVLSHYHPMVLMEVEHEEILDLFHQMQTDIAHARADQSAAKAFLDHAWEFIEYLRSHIVREDVGIFPMAERDLTPEEKQAVIQQMQTLRAQAVTDTVPLILYPERRYQAFALDHDTLPETPVTIRKLLQQEGLEIKQVNLLAGERLAPHWSARRVTLLCFQGLARFENEGREETLAPGQGIVMDPRLMHSLVALKDSLFLVLADEPPASSPLSEPRP